MITKLTDTEVASRLLAIRFKLRGLAHLLEYHRLDTIPLDIDDCMTGVGDLMNGIVGEVNELRSLFDPSGDPNDDPDTTRPRRRF